MMKVQHNYKYVNILFLKGIKNQCSCLEILDIAKSASKLFDVCIALASVASEKKAHERAHTLRRYLTALIYIYQLQLVA